LILILLLNSVSKSNLDKLAGVMVQYPDTNINIYGHTDSKGTDEYNLTLSEKRANSVIDYLVSKGIARTRLNAMGMGEKDPIATMIQMQEEPKTVE
jgi:outer membrane protein OmpA-like peptidoglycan-associated protein